MENECTNTQTRRFPITTTKLQLTIVIGVVLLFFGLSSCRTSKIKNAELLSLADQYAEAAREFQSLYRSTSRKEPEQKAYFAFKAAENFFAMRNFSRALGLYSSALTYKLPDSIILLRMAKCYQSLGKEKEASRFFDRYCAVDTLNIFAKIGLESLKERERLQKKENPLLDVRKANELSSASSDFAGCFSPDGSFFYFTSARSKSDNVPYSAVTGERQNRLYFIRKDAKGKWSRPDSVPGGINEGGDIGTPALSPDGSSLYYSFVEDTDEVSRTAKIYRSSKSGEGGWSKGTMLPIWIDTLKMAAHPAISSDGKTLYFVSEGGYGGKDIYSIPIEQIGSNIPPTNLGALINTPGNEIFPTIIGDSVLYFASDGRVGLGGYDLYKAQKDTLGVWQVSHLSSPINSEADDYAIAFNPNPREGYSLEGLFSTTRSDRRGYPHFYSFTQEAIHIILEGFVLDREDNPIEGALVRVVNKQNPLGETKVTTRQDGYFKTELLGDMDYLLLASHPNFLNQYTSFKTDCAKESEVYTLDFVLASRIKPEIFQDIFYDFDKATLREESKKELEEMAKILRENPDIVVEISSYADRKGSDAYNIKLSEKRARAVVDYLIEQGIDKQRLRSRGFGKSRPRIISKYLSAKYSFLKEGDCLDDTLLQRFSEEEMAICDQLNRRTEFSVVK